MDLNVCKTMGWNLSSDTLVIGVQGVAGTIVHFRGVLLPMSDILSMILAYSTYIWL